jgi:hypothetical protein
MTRTKQTARKSVGNKSIKKSQNLDIKFKRGRGLPRKELNVTVKRGPGRPRKELETSKQILIKSFNNNENKNICNIIFTSEIIKIINKQNNNFFLGVLDSVDCNSSKYLISCGIKKEQILLVEKNNDVYNSHIQNDFKTFKGSLNDLSKKKIVWTSDCLGWYFDTCGCIRTQEPGILNIIRDLNLINGSILGFTFSKRGGAGDVHKKKYEKFKNKLKKIINFKIIYELEYSGNKFMEPNNQSKMQTLIIKVIM